MAEEYVAKHKLVRSSRESVNKSAHVLADERGIRVYTEQAGTIEKALTEALAAQPENPYEALAAWFESKAGAAPATVDDKDFGTGEKQAGEANGYGVVAVDLAEEARKLKAAQPKPGDPNYIHLPGQNAPPPSESYRLALAPRFALPSLGG
jgi:hypothetical protein